MVANKPKQQHPVLLLSTTAPFDSMTVKILTVLKLIDGQQ